jgi:predicted alpha-1,2-mannosidase
MRNIFSKGQMIRLRFIAGVICLSTFSTASYAQSDNREGGAAAGKGLTQYVDPFIGTGAHGHVFLGANVPYGAVQLGPVNLSKGWDWCSGYNYSDSTITGFSHTHLSGTGIGDLGDISVMPQIEDVKYALFAHQDEVAKPGYYRVKLKGSGIKAELTASKRVGFHQYTFPAAKESKIILDLRPGIGWDAATETYIYQENETTVSGYRYSKGWAADQRIYFTAVFSRPIRQFSVYDSTVLQQGKQLKGLFVKGVAIFDTEKNEKIGLKVAISPVSIANAKLNIQAEIPGWDFNQQVSAANAEWNHELGRIVIQTDRADKKRIFYTALYHTMIAPSLFNDVNGDYFGADKQVHRNTAFSNYTTFSLWDTYRAAHPLTTLINPERASDLVNTMLAIYQQQGKLPVWHLVGNETDCMVGNPAIPVIADAYLKNIGGFDKDLAYEAMKVSGMRDDRGLAFVKKYGYIPADSVVENVAMGLEFAIADWSLAQVSKKRGNVTDYGYWSKRGQHYRNYFDKETGFMRGRISDAQWRTPFNPIAAVHQKDDFTEGNAWQYSWLVPQDVEGLVGLMGGPKAFESRLDSLFIVKDTAGVIASNDISGLIGQYAHGNEPSHHITYLYGYLGKPAKTAAKVRYIMEHLYTDKPDGLSGNEDVGQMSAWYVFSALGFYPVNPVNGQYVFGSPVVNHAVLKVGQGKTFQVSVKNNTGKNQYIQSIVWNGKHYSKAYILHSDIVKGGEMTITMGPKPSASWGVKPADRAFSIAR